MKPRRLARIDARLRGKLHGAGWLMFVLVFISAMVAASYFLTGFLYTITNLRLPALLAQVINTLLGLFFAGLVVSSAGKIARARGWFPERNLFQPVIDALERIARGDFRVRLEDGQENQMVSRLASSVNKMALELEQMEKLRQAFISDVSHEIQSPLTSIRGFAQALRGEHLTQAERLHYLTIIEDESTRLSRITENLLRLAALDAEQVKFEPKAYRLDKQIRGLILACEPQWVEKAVEMDAEMEEVSITADEDLLSQVWVNLIHNSIKFTPPGGRVCVTLRHDGQKAAFQIRDTGPGIAEEDQARIFERFYKADRARSQANGGSGLGLAIVKKIVELHGGTVAVESKVGEGATFRVTLPGKE